MTGMEGWCNVCGRKWKIVEDSGEEDGFWALSVNHLFPLSHRQGPASPNARRAKCSTAPLSTPSIRKAG